MPTAVDDARAILDTLKASADEEDKTGFDPSGMAHYVPTEMGEAESSPDRAISCPNAGSRSPDTDMTSMTQSLSSFGLKSSDRDMSAFSKQPEHRDTNEAFSYAHLDHDGQLNVLKEMFPTTSDFDIQFILKKNKGIVGRAMDELLTMSFLGDEQVDGVENIRPRGVEGFIESERQIRGRKGKGKGKNGKYKEDLERRSSSASAVATGMNPSALSKWEKAKQDIDLVSAKTSLSHQKVSSAYHNNGASLTGTIMALAPPLDSFAAGEQSVLYTHTLDLEQDFPTIPQPHLESIIRLTHPSEAAAHELAQALTRSTPSLHSPGNLSIDVRYAPLDLTDSDAGLPPNAPQTSMEFSDAQALAAAHGMRRSAAFAQAGSAYRRGKSDRLMGGAAAYYSQVGQEHAAQHHRYVSAAADAHVAGQSTASTLDLHGVFVADAVRIAEASVAKWWDRLGDAKYAPGGGGPARDGYSIITGAGKHSEGGKGRLGPAVGKMLRAKGWKFTVDDGVLRVNGRQR